jgi:hypothetical protein
VDTAADALHVAALCAGGPFPAAVAAHVPGAVAASDRLRGIPCGHR